MYCHCEEPDHVGFQRNIEDVQTAEHHMQKLICHSSTSPEIIALQAMWTKEAKLKMFQRGQYQKLEHKPFVWYFSKNLAVFCPCPKDFLKGKS